MRYIGLLIDGDLLVQRRVEPLFFPLMHEDDISFVEFSKSLEGKLTKEWKSARIDG